MLFLKKMSSLAALMEETLFMSPFFSLFLFYLSFAHCSLNLSTPHFQCFFDGWVCAAFLNWLVSLTSTTHLPRKFNMQFTPMACGCLPDILEGEIRQISTFSTSTRASARLVLRWGRFKWITIQEGESVYCGLPIVHKVGTLLCGLRYYKTYIGGNPQWSFVLYMTWLTTFRYFYSYAHTILFSNFAILCMGEERFQIQGCGHSLF